MVRTFSFCTRSILSWDSADCDTLYSKYSPVDVSGPWTDLCIFRFNVFFSENQKYVVFNIPCKHTEHLVVRPYHLSCQRYLSMHWWVIVVNLAPPCMSCLCIIGMSTWMHVLVFCTRYESLFIYNFYKGFCLDSLLIASIKLYLSLRLPLISTIWPYALSLFLILSFLYSLIKLFQRMQDLGKDLSLVLNIQVSHTLSDEDRYTVCQSKLMVRHFPKEYRTRTSPTSALLVPLIRASVVVFVHDDGYLFYFFLMWMRAEFLIKERGVIRWDYA